MSAAPNSASDPAVHVLTHCEVCQGTVFTPLADRDRDGKPLSTVICEGCGLVFTNPRPSPEAVKAYYKDSYRVEYKASLQPSPRHVYRAGQVAVERIGYLKPLLSPGCKVLDLGAGGGELLYLLRSQGYEAQGIEPNEGYGEFARTVLGLSVQLGGYQEAQVEPGSMDVVTAFHVVEHLEHPVEAMKVMKNWLRPGGQLLVEVPNVASTCQWPGSRFHFAHLFNFSPKTLPMAGRMAGLEVVRTFTSEDGGNVMCVYRRPEGDVSPVSGAVPGHAAEVGGLLRGHTALRHAFTAAPYVRPVERLLRRGREKKVLAKMQDPRALLDAAAVQVSS
jgi:2-polyprenyl-3-methyl-5-hydroxy-6-metoxy-1,4-benzoquinol methylase